MSDCTDVCEVVMDILIGLGYDIKTDKGDEDHADVLNAFCKYSQSYADLLSALKFTQTALANWRDEKDIVHPKHGILNLEEVKYLVVDAAITKAEPKQADESEN